MSKELDGQREAAASWPTMATKVIKVDEDKIRDSKEDIDTLMVFAGLFSAVTSAFLIESYKGLQPDQSDINNQLLAQTLLFQSNTSGRFSIDVATLTCIATSSCVGFNPPLFAKRVNILWFASLILSLVTASFGMLVKQWLREFLAGRYTSPRARLRIHLFRYPGLIQWRVFELVAILPLLLQLSLALFFTGLCFFTWSIHASVGLTALILVALWVLLFAIATVSPLLSPRCPYKTTFINHVMRTLRQYLARSCSFIAAHYRELSKFDAKDIEKSTPRGSSPQFEEEYFAEHAGWEDDLEILLAVDTMQIDDELFCTIIASLVKQKPQNPAANSGIPAEQTVLDFVTKFIHNRTDMRLALDTRPILHGYLTLNVWTTIVELVADFLLDGLSACALHKKQWDAWMDDAITLLLTRTDYRLPIRGTEALAHAFEANPDHAARLINERTPFPRFTQFRELTGQILQTDVFAELVTRELRGVLPLLHGQVLLDALLHLFRYRFSAPDMTSIEQLFESRLNTQWRPTHVNVSSNRAVSTLHVSENGCFKITLDLLTADIDHTFSGPCGELTESIKKTCSIVFMYREKWTDEQHGRVKSWLTSRRSLDWCFMLAFTMEEDQMSKTLGAMIRQAMLDLRQQLNLTEVREMIDSAIHVLRSRGAVSAFSQDGETGLDCLQLCEFLLETFSNQLDSPEPTTKKDMKTYKGLLHTLKCLDRPLSNFLRVHRLTTQCGPGMVEKCVQLCEECNTAAALKAKDELPGKYIHVLDALASGSTPVERAVDKWKRHIAPSQSTNTATAP